MGSYALIILFRAGVCCLCECAYSFGFYQINVQVNVGDYPALAHLGELRENTRLSMLLGTVIFASFFMP